MTILDDRPGLARLGPTPLSIITDALERAEGDLDGLSWDIYEGLDADTFRGRIKTRKSDQGGFTKFTVDDTRHAIACDLAAAGDSLRGAVLKILNAIADEVELEMIRLTD